MKRQIQIAIEETVSILARAKRKDELKEYINSLSDSTDFSIQLGLATYFIYKTSTSKILIDKLTHGRRTALVSIDTFIDYLTGETTNIDWN